MSLCGELVMMTSSLVLRSDHEEPKCDRDGIQGEVPRDSG